jgi:hypothetical protein
MLRERLLLLYPRAWRERYGEEFLATVGSDSPRPREVIDIVSGAIDAWLSADVRRMTASSRVAQTQGGPMGRNALLVCERKQTGVTLRDGLIGAGVMLGVTLLLKVLSAAATRGGFLPTADFLRSLVFPASFTLSMPFWLMKGQPWKAQLAIVGGTLVVLVGLGLLLPA